MHFTSGSWVFEGDYDLQNILLTARQPFPGIVLSASVRVCESVCLTVRVKTQKHLSETDIKYERVL